MTQARELARHSDVKMTMKYTHIGLKDQADALAAVPAPLILPASEDDQDSAAPDSLNLDPQTATISEAIDEPEIESENQDWQRLSSASGVFDGHLVSLDGTGSAPKAAGDKHQNPRKSKGFDVDCQQSSPIGGTDDNWRRRELNPRPVIP